LWSFGETGFHSLAAAVVRERFYRESMMSAFRILGEGQLSLTKFLLLTDQSIDVRNIKTVLTTVLERFKPETDLYVFANLSLDTLDYTGPELNKGSRGVMLGIGDPIRTLPHSYEGPLPRPATAAKPFCPGCLVVEVPSYESFKDINILCSDPSFAKWPLVILVDNLAKATKDDASFLWTTFTRFEPAADIHTAESQVYRHHLCYRGPIVIDARMKPSYPPEVTCDSDTARLVTSRWKQYFPAGMAMGDSDAGHVV
jgi:3-polyprenyl-4-hydroxybenzoate decarboxylase